MEQQASGSQIDERDQRPITPLGHVSSLMVAST